MFSNVKAMIALIIGVVIAIGVGIIWYQHREVGHLNQENGADKVVIGAQQQAASEAQTTIHNQQASAQATDAGNIAINNAPVKNDAQQAAVQQNTTTVISTIKQQYNTQPKTEANALAEDQAIAQAQIDGLWTTYCNVEPSNAQCVAH